MAEGMNDKQKKFAIVELIESWIEQLGEFCPTGKQAAERAGMKPATRANALSPSKPPEARRLPSYGLLRKLAVDGYSWRPGRAGEELLQAIRSGEPPDELDRQVALDAIDAAVAEQTRKRAPFPFAPGEFSLAAPISVEGLVLRYAAAHYPFYGSLLEENRAHGADVVRCSIFMRPRGLIRLLDRNHEIARDPQPYSTEPTHMPPFIVADQEDVFSHCRRTKGHDIRILDRFAITQSPGLCLLRSTREAQDGNRDSLFSRLVQASRAESQADKEREAAQTLAQQISSSRVLVPNEGRLSESYEALKRALEVSTKDVDCHSPASALHYLHAGLYKDEETIVVGSSTEYHCAATSRVSHIEILVTDEDLRDSEWLRASSQGEGYAHPNSPFLVIACRDGYASGPGGEEKLAAAASYFCKLALRLKNGWGTYGGDLATYVQKGSIGYGIAGMQPQHKSWLDLTDTGVVFHPPKDESSPASFVAPDEWTGFDVWEPSSEVARSRPMF